MATQAQIEANRRNAQKSTGPRTAAGKAVSRGNAWRHGFFCQTVRFTDEQQKADFAQLREAMLQSHDPRSSIEIWLVDQIVLALWKLRLLQGAQPPEEKEVPASWSAVMGPMEKLGVRVAELARAAREAGAAHALRSLGWEEAMEKREQRLINRVLRLRRELRDARAKGPLPPHDDDVMPNLPGSEESLLEEAAETSPQEIDTKAEPRAEDDQHLLGDGRNEANSGTEHEADGAQCEPVIERNEANFAGGEAVRADGDNQANGAAGLEQCAARKQCNARNEPNRSPGSAGGDGTGDAGVLATPETSILAGQ